MGMAIRGSVLGVVLGIAAWSAAASATVLMETVYVGNPGNNPDPRTMQDGTTGYGQVDYGYNIGKYEVTAGQYTEFLNAVAGIDTYSLYRTEMSTSTWGCKIQRTGMGTAANPYQYQVAPEYANRPVTSVNFWSSCRFANWLSNGQQGPGTTEYGVYALHGSLTPDNKITRGTAGQWVVASENEWYKAAYYNPATGKYYRYATSSNLDPGIDLEDSSHNNANYDAFVDLPFYTTVVGAFANSVSPYGTYDQSGNAWEWTDTILVDAGTTVGRAQRGGAYNSDITFLAANYRGYGSPGLPVTTVGFRVVQLPEPGTLSVLGLGVAGLLVKRRRICA